MNRINFLDECSVILFYIFHTAAAKWQKVSLHVGEIQGIAKLFSCLTSVSQVN